MILKKHVLAASAVAVCTLAAGPAFGDFKVIQSGQRSDAPAPPKPQQPQFGQYRLMESVSPVAQPSTPPARAGALQTLPVSLPLAQEIPATSTARSDNQKLLLEVLRLQSESERLQAEVQRLRADLAAVREQLAAAQQGQPHDMHKASMITQELDRIEQHAAEVGAAILRVRFGPNSTKFAPSDEIGKQIVAAGRKASRINVSGHADNSGPAERNKIVAMARAVSTKRYMTDHGIAASKITVASRGSSEPVADNETEEGRAQNRRVEIEFKH